MTASRKALRNRDGRPRRSGRKTATAASAVPPAALPTWLLALLLLGAIPPTGQPADAVPGSPRQNALTELESFLPPSPPWTRWLEATGEQPPDFDQWPSEPGLANPFAGLDPRAEAAAWKAVRRETLDRFGHFVYGTSPTAEPVKPVPAQAEPEPATEGWRPIGTPPEAAGVPALIGWIRGARPAKPRPLAILCGGAEAAVAPLLNRGWIVARPGPAAKTAPPVPAISDGAARALKLLDALLSRGDVVTNQIALLGRGFGGKAALWAAAQDERVTAVLAIDSGLGGACPFRLWTEAEFGPGIEITTREHPGWFSPRLRFFVGRENRLPVDQHLLLACLAPRACLLATAENNPAESAWAVEQAWRAARPVFVAAGAEDRFALDVRPGAGEVSADDWRNWLDWLDSASRGDAVPAANDRRKRSPLISGPRFPTLAGWRAAGGVPLNPDDFPPQSAADLLVSTNGELITTPDAWPAQRARLRALVRRALGPAPVESGHPAANPAAAARPWTAPPNLPPWLHAEPLRFGDGITGTVLHRTNLVGTTRRLPALIWLPPWSVPTGFRAAACRAEQPWRALTRSGSVVLAFDPIGCGTRVEEGWHFFAGHPGESLLGRMVADVREAVTALADHPHVDPEQIFLLGCGLGGAVALHAAALDDRVAGALCIGGLTPWRQPRPDHDPDPLRRWTRQPPLLPGLADFAGHEAQLPYDFDTLLALIAPRPVLVVAARLDPAARLAEVRGCVEGARPVFALLGAPKALVFQAKDDYTHFTPDQIWCLCDDRAQQ